MRILVTGGGGFAGQHLLREIVRASPGQVFATMLGEPPVWPAGDPLASVEWLSLDLSCDESVRDAVERSAPEAVYHLAGQASVGESLRDPLTTWEVNATGTLRLLVHLTERGRQRVRFVLASSAEVYGAVPDERQPIEETCRVEPVTPYGTSKAAAELIVRQMCRAWGYEVVVARSFNHIGPGQDPRFVLASMAAQLVAIRRGVREPVLRAGSLDVERDFLDVRDAARAYVTLMERGEGGAVYNISLGEGRTLLAVIERLIEISETGARLEIDPSRVRSVDIPRLIGDSGRLRCLGWEPAFDLDTTLRDLLAEAERRA